MRAEEIVAELLAVNAGRLLTRLAPEVDKMLGMGDQPLIKKPSTWVELLPAVGILGLSYMGKLPPKFEDVLVGFAAGITTVLPDVAVDYTVQRLRPPVVPPPAAPTAVAPPAYVIGEIF